MIHIDQSPKHSAGVSGLGSHARGPFRKAAELLLNDTAQVVVPAGTSRRILILGQKKSNTSALLLPSPELLHLSVLLFLQLDDKTLQDGHLKLDVLRHLVE